MLDINLTHEQQQKAVREIHQKDEKETSDNTSDNKEVKIL